MSEIRNKYSDYVRYYLVLKGFEPLFIDTTLNWRDPNLKFTRNVKNHGVLVQSTDSMQFYKEARDYIKTAYSTEGVNTNLFLVKQILIDDGNDIKWVNHYETILLADFKTMQDEDNVLSINFNSNNLYDIIKSHEGTKLEVERETDLDGEFLPEFIDSRMDYESRHILLRAESKDRPVDTRYELDSASISPLTELITRGGLERFSSVDTYKLDNTFGYSASNMFFVWTPDDVNEPLIPELNIDIDFEFTWRQKTETKVITVYLYRHKYVPGDEYQFNPTEVIELYKGTQDGLITINESLKFIDLAYDEGLSLSVIVTSATAFNFNVIKNKIIAWTDSYIEPISNLRFAFTHDIADRLVYIMSGRNDAFHSQFFGRPELLDTNNNQRYSKYGERAMIANISGMWSRGFNVGDEKYKSLAIEFKELLDSAKVTFNVGMGIERFGFKERVRIEKQEFFYRPKVGIKLTESISKVKRTIDKGLLFNKFDIGYEKGGDYESEIGLDEPNTHTIRTSPIKKSNIGFEKKSKIRGDDYGLELTVRKQQIDYPTEDTPRDDSIWWLDMKKLEGTKYTRKSWDDVLQKLPTGIHSPETFKGMIFTPLRILLRHGWVIRGGLRFFEDKYLQYADSFRNSNLSMLFKNEAKEYSEKDSILVGDLDRNVFDENIIEFEYPVNQELIDKLLSYKKDTYYGIEQNIPMYYFQIEFINENDEIERGYLLNMTPKDGVGTFKLQRANF